MKTRQGFVSNSSSSSFIIVIPKEVHEKALEYLSDFEKLVVKECVYDKGILFGRSIVAYDEWTDMNGYNNIEGTEIENYDGDRYDGDLYDAMDKWKARVRELSKEGEIFTISQDH